jgi:pimeloyl-ACP methyl ester carboxylesterase
VPVTTFVLIHGAWHGAWCWERLEAALAQRGHRSVAVDLPSEDPASTFATYADAVLAAVPTGTDADDLVVVGHSLGAMVVPLVAAAHPGATSVFLCGVIPNVLGASEATPPMEQPGAFDAVVTHADGSTSWPDLVSATTTFYSDCTDTDAEWAFARLRHHHHGRLWPGPYPLPTAPPGRRVAIAATDDPAVTIVYSRAMCGSRLGVVPVEIPGGHSPFLAQPDALADLLVATR